MIVCGINGCTYEHERANCIGIHRRHVHGITGTSHQAKYRRTRTARDQIFCSDASILVFDTPEDRELIADLAEAWALPAAAALAELKRRLLDAIEHDRYVRDLRARRQIAAQKQLRLIR